MPLHIYSSIQESGRVPDSWEPKRGGVLKYPVRNRRVRRYLRLLVPGRWQKVIKQGTFGEVHYFEHESGQVAGVKYFANK